MIGDFFESILNIDSKIFKTLGALFIPGKLTEAYFRGQQKRYVPPTRLFFVMAVIHFAVLGYLAFGQLEDQMDDMANETISAPTWILYGQTWKPNTLKCRS